MIATGWLLTRRALGGFLSGVIYALYPVAIFYSTEFLVEELALFFVCLFLFLSLWQRERRSWWRTVTIGLVLGLTTITRTNLALLLPAWVLWLFLIEGDKRRALAHALVSFLMMALAIAPVTLWNFQAGSHQLITNVGMEEIYRANSRDADGTYIKHNDSRMVEGDYAAALIDDVQRDPLHFVAVQVRKLGLYWSDAEPANNIDYYENGEAASPLLRSIPLDFRVLAAFGLLGTLALWLDRRRVGLYFAAIHLLIFAGVMVIWVVSRVRLPAIAPLIATAAYLPIWVWDQGSLTRGLRRIAPAAVVIVALLVFCGWAIDHALVKHPLAQLPDDARPANIVFDDRLKLVGWRWFDQWSAAARGWAQPTQSYGIELFWQLSEPTREDYSAYLAYIQAGTRYVSHDAIIGTVSQPPLPTSQWKPGEIYSEIMGFKFPHDIPSAQTGEIHLGVYRRQGDPTDLAPAVVTVPITSDPAAQSDLILQSMAVFDPGVQPSLPDGLAQSSLVFGDQIALDGYRLPEAGTANSTATFEFQWRAIADIPADYVLFIHVIDANDQPQAAYDAPVGGALLSSNWQPGYPVYERISIPLPSEPGSYRVYIGLYHPQTNARLPVDAPDNRPLVGEIVVG